MRAWMVAVGTALGAVIGCVGPTSINNNGSGGSGASTIGGDSGLPCAIASVLSERCVSCHGSTPSTGVPMSLMSYADLTASSKSDPTKTNAQLSLERMVAKTMPPGGGATAADIEAFQAWVDAGTPMGTCGGPDAGPPDPTFQGDPTCTGTIADHITEDAAENLGDFALARMNPGEACVTCHQGDPNFKFAGTVFATGKVKDRCLPPAGIDWTKVRVVITDKNGTDHQLSVNAVGNFHSPENASYATPYTARVEYDVDGVTKVRAMGAAQTSGDCNKCHAETPTDGAPGRIALPQ